MMEHEANLAAIVERQARLSPERVAVVADRPQTYADVRARMLEFAAGFAALDLPANSTIAVLAPRDGDLVPLLLAILWAGHAYLPIDPDEPPPRTLRMLDIARCAAIVCPRAIHRALSGAGPVPRHIDAKALRHGGGASSACAPGAERLAYVIFTSGSTGEPKGVEISHSAVVNLLHAIRDVLRMTEDDRQLATTTIAFDIAVAELFLPLIVGASVLLRDRTLLLEPGALREEVVRHDLTCVQMGPSAWSVLLSHDLSFPRVRIAVSTGEPIAPRLAARLAGVADEAWNLYGPTEAAVWASAHRLRANEPTALSTISAPIGRPLNGYRLLVMDAAGQIVQDDTEGELLIGGAGLASGYSGRADLTAERFIDLPEHGGRFYRTGDLVRRDAGGVFHYFGRNDDQIKIRGIRIEPREIESALLAVPEILHAAATWYTSSAGNRAIAAGVVWRNGRQLTPEHLRGRLEGSLPAAMVPSRFAGFDRLPLTASGKIDRAAIRAIAEAPPAPQSQPSYSRSLILTDTQARLAMIWAKALDVGTVELDDNFFDAGGDSLSAVTMLLDVEKLFDVRLSAQDVWNAPTLAAMAKLIDRSRGQPDDIANRSPVYPMVQAGSGRPVFFNGANTKLTRPGVWRLDCPLYGMAQWAHGRGFIKANTIEELAARQIEDIRKIQPAGPYRLAGFSLGGLIALEIAQQLKAAGEDVELLFLLDPMMPVRYALGAKAAVEDAPGYVRRPVAVRVRDHLRAIMRDPRRQIPHVWTRVLGQSPLWQQTCYRLVDLHGRHPGWLTRAVLPRDRGPAFWYAAGRLAQSYVARPYDGPAIAVFHRREERFRLWSDLLKGPTRIEIIETTHLGMYVAPAMTTWLDALGQSLEGRSQEAPPASRLICEPEPRSHDVAQA